ncbi:phosphatase PAP2 family protein [Mycobacterium sp. ITM-2016-00317]|uniref:vanadium-dependent haloperoxidase n=1 Tax=Mycobacterium sp. ITM-2016-00317 TaxID=2099694 RepID=UPI00287F50F9|nr:phosphatase PAP2 family protein [Mycobacterium sp. ITM-2016-00317]WNG85899.1 phosphatase PAP2 family protein [Mycobacterium sp. ITM-2016-00317]
MNSVLYWNSVLLEASRRDFSRGYVNNQQPGPIRTARAMAMVHLAVHDAVAFHPTGNPAAAYLTKKGQPPVGVSGPIDDVIAGAAVTMLKHLYPAYGRFFDDALGRYNNGAFGSGAKVAMEIIKLRTGDGSDVSIEAPQVPTPAYGEHRADPYSARQPRLGPVWGNVTRFAESGHQMLAPFPGHNHPENHLLDPDYKDDFEEVRDYGSVQRKLRTAEQERIGVYWGYDGANNLGVPPRLYNQIARKVLENRSLNQSQTAELFAVLNVAMADAGIDAWYYKYVHNVWRPVIGIRNEPAPHGDPFWAPLGAPQTNGSRATATPPFPAYPSGHASFGAAVMQVLRLGLIKNPSPITVADVLDVETGDSVPVPEETFTFVSDELDGIAADPDGSLRALTPVTFKNFVEPVWENSVSRVYLGVHWRFDGIPRNPSQKIGGVPLGLAVGSEAHQFFNNAPSLGEGA